EQELVGSPLERVLAESITEIDLEPAAGGTRVTIAQRQKLRGYSRTGGVLWGRAAGARLAPGPRGLRPHFRRGPAGARAGGPPLWLVGRRRSLSRRPGWSGDWSDPWVALAGWGRFGPSSHYPTWAGRRRFLSRRPVV